MELTADAVGGYEKMFRASTQSQVLIRVSVGCDVPELSPAFWLPELWRQDRAFSTSGAEACEKNAPFFGPRPCGKYNRGPRSAPGKRAQNGGPVCSCLRRVFQKSWVQI